MRSDVGLAQGPVYLRAVPERRPVDESPSTARDQCCSTAGFDKQQIATLFMAGYVSSAIFGTVVASLVDKIGRKKGKLLSRCRSPEALLK